MSRPHTDFVRDRLDLWQRRIRDTAEFLELAQAATPLAGLLPVLDQLVAVHNLASGIVSDLHQSTESALATTDTGRAYLSQLTTALAHTHRAATHLSATVTVQAGSHRLTASPAIRCQGRAN